MNHVMLLTVALFTSDLQSRRDVVVDVVQKVSPAVVYIGTVQVVESRFRPRSPFEELFGGQDERRAVEGLGTGVLVDPSGVIITNEHVVRGASEIHVVLADGRQLDAEVVGADAENDLAVVRINPKGPVPFAKLGTSSDLMIGEKAIAIGSPFGLKKSVTVGVVSALGRSFKADGRTYNDFIQTDASINPGNSGGPLLNIDGEVIGINSAIFNGAQGIGFAIPADKVRRVIAELAQYGKVRPAWVGLEVQPLTAELGKRLGWDRTYGALVWNVEAGSPAEQAGVQRGDIVTQMGTTQLEDADDFQSRLKSYPAKTPLALTLVRNGQALNVVVTPVEFPPRLAEGLAWDRLGLKLKATQLGMQVIAVRPGSPSNRVGIEAGDMVVRLNNQPLTSLEVFKDAIIAARGGKSVLLLVRRGRAGYYLTLPF